MSPVTADEHQRSAWPMRLFEAAPVPYPVVSAALLVAWIACAGAINALSGEYELALAEQRFFWLVLAELLQGVLIVFLLTCEYLGQRSSVRDLEKLRSQVETDDTGFARLLAEACQQKAYIEWICVVVPLLFGLAMVQLDPAIWLSREKPEIGSALFIWAVLRNSLLGWALARLLYAEVRWTRAFVAMAERLLVPLPAGPDPEAFLRKGLRSAATWLVFSSLFSIFWVGNSAGTLNPLLFVLNLTTATCALLIPLRAFRVTVHEAKQAELLRIDAEIERERAPLLEGTSSDSARLGSLAAWRGLVDGVDERPLSAPTAIRFGLFVLLGLGSWLGGALVERGLDVLFE